MPTTDHIVQGIAINFKGSPWLIIQTNFVNPGKGAAFTRAKMRNLKTDQVLEITFKSGEQVELADVVRRKCQYLYKDGSGYNFMDNDTYDQFTLTNEIIGNANKFLQEGIECYALHIDGNAVNIQLPPKMDFKVIEAEPGVKGDTATGGEKECKIETGTSIKVPLFIKEGDKITVNTENGSYVSRA